MTTAPPDKAAILLVDDREENLIALEAVLGPLDQQLVRATSGEDALKAMLRQDFAVVLLDVQMPGMDGIETASNIKRLDQTKDVPIIIVTGTDADVYRGYSVGAADFLIKPFAPWLLRTKVNVFLELYRKNLQLARQTDQLQRQLAAARTPNRDRDRLEEIGEQLARMKDLLADADQADAARLAPHIAAAEHALEKLRSDRAA